MKKIIRWAKSNIVLLFSILVCCWCMTVMVHYSGKSLWGDSIGTIFIANPNHSLLETLRIDVTEDVFVAPLFYLVANVWLKIAPYGTRWVKLICEIFICLGMIVSAQTAKKMFGNAAGIFTVLFLSVSSYLAIQGGYEFRNYALWFLFTACLLWLHDRKIKQPTWGSLIAYGICAILCCYTHFNGVLFFFTLFLWDLYLWLKKKITIRHISSYLLWGVLFFPYLVYAYFHAKSLTDGFWPAPGLKDFFGIDKQLLIHPLFYGLFWAAILWALYITFAKKDSRTAFLLWVIMGYRIINFVYSNLNEGYSMWIPRYFFCQMAPMMILCGWAAADVFHRLYHGRKVLFYAAAILFCAGFLLLEIAYIHDLRANRYPEHISQPFEQDAEILRKQPDFWDPDTAFYYSACNIEAWQYYLAHGDMTPGLLNLLHIGPETDLSPYRVIYVCELQNAIDPQVWEKLNTEFDFEELNHDYRVYQFTRK